ncbi:MAG: lamin tail domain-containing protein [Proteobacteria bacterium]|nr:lamin tail domain-containing protein [Pseudomonadota bacterium]
MSGASPSGAIVLAVVLASCASSGEVPEPTPNEPVDIDETLYVHGYTQPWPRLVVNEIMAVNGGAVLNPAGRSADWIELHNPTPDDVDLADWSLTDDASEPDKHVLDALVLPAEGYLVLWADAEASLGSEHLSFALAGEGDALGLYAPDGTTLDLLTFGPQASDVALARLPDASGPWTLTLEGTPGAPNEASR